MRSNLEPLLRRKNLTVDICETENGVFARFPVCELAKEGGFIIERGAGLTFPLTPFHYWDEMPLSRLPYGTLLRWIDPIGVWSYPSKTCLGDFRFSKENGAFSHIWVLFFYYVNTTMYKHITCLLDDKHSGQKSMIGHSDRRLRRKEKKCHF
jgi:hypothetical protein